MKKQHKWWHQTMVALLLAPTLLMGSVSIVGLTTNSTIGTTVAFAKNPPKDPSDTPSSSDKPKKNGGGNDGDKGKSAASSESSSQDNSASNQPESPWDKALDTLGKQAADNSDPNKKQEPAKSGSGSDSSSSSGDKDKQAVFYDGDPKNSANLSTHSLNIWGFMGVANNLFWNTSNNSSASTSYSSMDSAVATQQGDAQAGKAIKNPMAEKYAEAYQAAGRFAYVMQTMGLDQSYKSGFKGPDIIHQLAGLIEQLAYFVLDFANKLYGGMLDFLSAINPLAWALDGNKVTGSIDSGASKPSDGIWANLALTINKLYGSMTGLGWAIMGIILALSLALAGMGVTVSTSSAHVGQGRAIINVGVNLLKRMFVWAILPVMCLFVFTGIIQYAKGAFEAQNTSVSNYAVFGSMVDYHDWVMHSRLAIPQGVSLSSTFDSKEIMPLSHNDIMKINQYGAGKSELSGLIQTAQDQGVTYSALSGKNDKGLDAAGKAMLNAWRSGSSIQASDYGSAEAPYVRYHADDNQNGGGSGKSPDKSSSGSESGSDGSGDQLLQQELVKPKYNNNATNQQGGNVNSPFQATQGNLNLSHPVIDAVDQGGLSTLGTYAYLETTADPTDLNIVRPSTLGNETAQPRHASVVLVGQGIESSGNLVWAFGLSVGFAFLVVGYLVETLRTIIESIMGLTMGTLETAMASLRGGVKLVSVIAALVIGVFGSAIMYMIATKAFISIGLMSDTVLRSSDQVTSVINFLTMNSNSSEVGQLAGQVNASVMNGAINWVEGLFLLWIAWLLLHYRGVVVASLSSLVEETANKIMATFGSLTRQGSAGTRGMIMSNTNTKNAMGNIMKSAGATAAPMAGMAAMGGGMSALANMGKDSKNSAQKEGAQKSQAANNRDRASQYGNHSSSNKQGHAAEKSNQMSNVAKDHVSNKQRQDLEKNAAQANEMMPPANEANGLRDTANSGAGVHAQADKAAAGQFQNLSYGGNMSNNAMTDMDNMNSLNDQGPIGMDENSAAMNADNLQNSMNGDQAGLNGNMDQNMAMDQNGLGAETYGDQMGANGDMDQNMAMNQDGLGNETYGDQMGANGDMEQSMAMNQQDLANQIYGDQNTAANSDLRQNQGNQMQGDQLQQHQAGNQSHNGTIGATTRQGNLAMNQTNGDLLGSSMSNNLQNMPVNKDMTAANIQSQMGDIQQANQLAERSTTLAQQNPTNQTLQNSAQAAQKNLAGLQNSALRDYNSQSISNTMPQSNWLANKTDPSSVSVGATNKAMNNVYQAQQGLQQATQRYGAGSKQVAQAQNHLQSARSAAVSTGLSSRVVNDTKSVAAAHAAINTSAAKLMNGTWSPQSGGVAHLSEGLGRTIGV